MLSTILILILSNFKSLLVLNYYYQVKTGKICNRAKRILPTKFLVIENSQENILGKITYLLDYLKRALNIIHF